MADSTLDSFPPHGIRSCCSKIVNKPADPCINKMSNPYFLKLNFFCFHKAIILISILLHSTDNFMPPLKKEGHIALHMSVVMSVGRLVCRYPITLCN